MYKFIAGIVVAVGAIVAISYIASEIEKKAEEHQNIVEDNYNKNAPTTHKSTLPKVSDLYFGANGILN